MRKSIVPIVVICVAGAVMAAEGCKKKEEPKTEAVTVVVPPPGSPLIEHGMEVFKEKCVVCHSINGIGGTIGTDLSKVGQRHDAVFLQTQLQDPTIYKKDTRMPSFKDMPKNDKDSLIAYLLTLK